MSSFQPVKNDTFLRALRREATEYTPVWLMRQAGRYLPEYRATRAKAGNFMGLCTNPEAACEVTLQPLERYKLDAAILFSDILTVPDAMGLGLYFAEGEGPKFERPLVTEADVAKLAVPDIGTSLRYVTDAVSTIRGALGGRVPLIGFSGSPWTLACYMVEGGGSSDFRKVKTMLYKRPDLMHRILEVTTEAVSQYLRAQIDAGAQAVMIFDSWGGALADGAFQKFSLNYIKKIVASLPLQANRGDFTENIPSIVFTKGGGLWLEDIASSGASAVGVDWTVNLGQARARIGDRCAIQGNLDPNVLFAEPAQIEAEVAKALESFGVPQAGAGHVFNLGHGISQFTNPDSVEVMVNAVHAYSRKQRQ
ncbi:uroporphyrinogen decarboxylase [Limnobacter sp. P1]|uniref:uroporphyrinogen decarboxylase n=1 Tax=Limnobacter olei TaxID=3031298 RepID=UPI0023B162D8|nr:uroporphyrinogen decarboxylase [Limnobacter sp. P1]